MTAERQPLLNGNEYHRTSFIQKVSGVLQADGEPGWIASTKFLLFSSWFNIFLLFIPLSIASGKFEWDAGLRFAFSFVAIIPLAKLLGDATEQLSMRLGQTLGGLLNASFGNAVEIIVGVVALLQGGLYYHEQNFQVTAAQTGASLMTLACITLVIPAAYHSSQEHPSKPLSVEGALSALMETDAPSGSERSREGLLLISRGAAIILLFVYVCYLIFQLKTHADLFATAESEEEEEASMSVISAGTWLLIVTVITAFCADILVGSIEQTAETYHIPKTFIGLIILPLVANAAEHVTSVWMATKGKLELTIGISVGSSIQIAAFVVPLLVIISWIIGKELTLYFADFETVSLFVTVILVNLHIMDGKSNYMEGLMLCALYVVIAIAFWVS
ncbi:hypothetical protein FRC10_003371 [Ceratobasidium sp. 414]|nr:hypothetical protein FRC10_003371 [Ceratobasidium sp. 414]